jgi:hypothetical protein
MSAVAGHAHGPYTLYGLELTRPGTQEARYRTRRRVRAGEELTAERPFPIRFDPTRLSELE